MKLKSENYNNFDILRFIAASLVILSHAYPLTLGNNELEPLLSITTRQVSIGYLAVAIFFLLSGYLITKSYLRVNKIIPFMKARALRIFPGLFVCLFITSFVFGPLLSNLPLVEYFRQVEPYRYILGISLLQFTPSLPEVFSDNPFGNAVNGSLWTLKYEFFFYVVVAISGTLKLLNKKFVLLLFMICIIFNLTIGDTTGHLLLDQVSIMSELLLFFIVGISFYIFKEQILFNKFIALFCILIIIITAKTGGMKECLAVFGGYLLFYMAFNKNFIFASFSKYGDFSYGIYIYAFIIQQTIVQLVPTAGPFLNFIISLPITLIFAVLSWHVIEKNALKLKDINLFVNRQELMVRGYARKSE